MLHLVHHRAVDDLFFIYQYMRYMSDISLKLFSLLLNKCLPCLLLEISNLCCLHPVCMDRGTTYLVNILYLWLRLFCEIILKYIRSTDWLFQTHFSVTILLIASTSRIFALNTRSLRHMSNIARSIAYCLVWIVPYVRTCRAYSSFLFRQLRSDLKTCLD